MKNHLSMHKILLSLAGFLFLWTVVTDAWGYSEHFFNFRSGNYLYAYLSRLIWVLPAVLLIIRSGNSLYFSKKELFSHPCVDKPLMIVVSLSLVYVVVTILFCS